MVNEVQHVHGAAGLAEAFDAAEPLLKAGRVPGQVHVDEGAEGLEVQALAGGIGGDDQADAPLLDGLLDLLALDGGELVAPEHAAFSGAGVDGNRLAGQRLGQLGGHPVHRVVILAEDDAAMLEPGFPFGPVLGQEIADGGKLRVAGLRARQFLDDGAEMPCFGRG